MKKNYFRRAFVRLLRFVVYCDLLWSDN